MSTSPVTAPAPQVAELRRGTSLLAWPGRCVVVDLPVDEPAELLVSASGCRTMLIERDQVSLPTAESAWARSPLTGRAHRTGDTFSIVAIDQDVDLDVSGRLAVRIAALSEVVTAIIPLAVIAACNQTVSGGGPFVLAA